MGHLNELSDKYSDKGFRIVSVSSESISQIESVMVTQLGAKFWMASDPSRTTLAPFGSGGIPHAYLVDARGTVRWDGHPASLKDAQIEELLEGAFDPALGRELHKSLHGLVKQYDKGQYGKAWAGAARYAENDDRGVASDAVFLRERCEAAAAFAQKMVESSIKTKDYATAFNDLKTIGKSFAGMEIVKWAAETKRSLVGDDAVKNEMSAWKAYQKAQGKELKAEGKAKKLKPAVTAYKRIVKKYPGTRAAELAEKALARLPG